MSESAKFVALVPRKKKYWSILDSTVVRASTNIKFSILIKSEKKANSVFKQVKLRPDELKPRMINQNVDLGALLTCY